MMYYSFFENKNLGEVQKFKPNVSHTKSGGLIINSNIILNNLKGDYKL